MEEGGQKNTRQSLLSRKLQWIKEHRRLSVGVLLVLVVAGVSIWLIHNQNTKKTVYSSNPVVASYQKQLPGLANAAKNKPQDSKAHYDYAVALYATGDVAKAKDQYEQAAKLNPKDATTENNLGNVYRDSGDYEKAIQAYQQSISLNDKSTNAYINLANVYLYSLSKKDLAITTYQEALRNLPGNQDIQVLLGIAYEQSGNKSAARDAFQAVLATNSGNAAAQAGLKRVQ